MLSPRTLLALTAIGLLVGSTVHAVAPNPLEDAYWRFEEGSTGSAVPPPANPDDPTNDAVQDSTNENHMRSYVPVTSPIYTSDVPSPTVPATGAANTLALLCKPNANHDGGQDIYTELKNIDNPQVTAFTLEATFKADDVGFYWHSIVAKEGRVDNPDTPGDESLPNGEPVLVLEIRGGVFEPDAVKVQCRFYDKSKTYHELKSLAPAQVGQWYHAAVVGTATEVKLYLDSGDGNGYVLQDTETGIAGGGPIWQGPDGGNTSEDDGLDTHWCIGRGWWLNDPADWFDGTIDEVRLSNTALAVEDFLFYQVDVPGDFDGDGDVDVQDRLKFEPCWTGPTVLYDPQDLPAGCDFTPDDQDKIPPDMDADGDVDQVDFGTFQVLLDLSL